MIRIGILNVRLSQGGKLLLINTLTFSYNTTGANVICSIDAQSPVASTLTITVMVNWSGKGGFSSKELQETISSGSSSGSIVMSLAAPGNNWYTTDTRTLLVKSISPSSDDTYRYTSNVISH